MGTLRRFDLNRYIEAHGCEIFVETGTGHGTSLDYARSFPFKHYYSVECFEKTYLNIKHYDDDNSNITIYHDYSVNMFKDLCKEKIKDRVCFFWLDAHFPGSDTGDTKHGESASDESIRLPLESEIRTLVENKQDLKYDTFIIDDIAIYESVEGFVTPEDAKPKNMADRNLDFVEKLLGETHDIKKVMNTEQGYIFITPKNNKC